MDSDIRRWVLTAWFDPTTHRIEFQMADAKPAPARSAAKNTGTTTTTTETVEATGQPVDPAHPETANVGTATNDPSASETLAEGTPVDPTSGPQGAPSPLAPGGRTGYHCGYCGESIGAEGQHYHASGEQRTTPHAGTMVVADNWPQERPANPGTSEDETADQPEARQQNDTGTTEK